MSFDFQKTMTLIKGGLLDHQTTWDSYLSETPDWKKTAITLVGPLVLGSIVLQVIFARLLGGLSLYNYPGTNILVSIIVGLIIATLSFVILTLSFNFLAGKMDGKENFDRCFAAVGLALIPSYVCSTIGSLIPFIGALITLSGFIVSLIFLWKIMPKALQVPEESRTVHFVGALALSFVINIIMNVVLGAWIIGNVAQNSFNDYSDRHSNGNSSGGIFSDFERHGNLIEDAENDRYEPPEDGKVDKKQVETLLANLNKAEAAQERYSERLEKLSEDMENKETPSLADLGKIYSGIGGAVGAFNAEMEVVKTGDGNWAEHEWVKQQLRIAVIQQGEGSKANEHNFSLYERYQEELSEYF